jgi:inner membrane protein
LAIDRGRPLQAALAASASVARLVAWSGDGCKVERVGDEVRISDLRLGQEPWYLFTFVVGNVGPAGVEVVEPPRTAGNRIPFALAVPWLWARMWGERLPTPR